MGKNELMVHNLNTFRGFLESADAQKQLAEVVPRKYLQVDQLARISLSVVRYNPKLQVCTPQSLLVCVMGCARLGLMPEPFLGQAYFVPFWNSKLGSYEATFMPGYRGYVALGRRAADMRVSAQVVYERDQFTIQWGLEEKLSQIPASGDRGQMIGAWTTFKYSGEVEPSFDYMLKADIDAIKDRTKSRNKAGEIVGPWITDYNEMAKKTVIRRHIKLAPLCIDKPSEDINRLHMASHAEERALIGADQKDLFLPGAAPVDIRSGDGDGSGDGSGSGSGSGSSAPIDIKQSAGGAEKPQTDAESWSKQHFSKRMADLHIPKETMDEFISIVAASNHIAEDEAMEQSLREFPAFIAAFRKWVAARHGAKQGGDGGGQDQGGGDGDGGGQRSEQGASGDQGNGSIDWENFRSKWINLHQKNFRAFVKSQIDKFKSAPDEILAAAIEKWRRQMPDESCPLENEKSGGTQSDAASTDTTTDQTPTASPGGEIGPNSATESAHSFDDLVQTDEWGEMSVLKGEFPELYEQVTGGETPKTMDRVRKIIDLIYDEVGPGGLDTGKPGGIPNGDGDGDGNW
jgi:phage RecT family recombinase